MRLRPHAARPTVAARVILAAALAGIPLASPALTVGVGPLPDCRFGDILTVPRGYDDGPVTLVDHLLSAGKDYAPPDLMSVYEMGLAGSGQIRRIAAKDTRAMARDAAENGTPIGAWSAYRSYQTQRKLYRDGVAAYGVKVASRAWARPGHSEHNLGLGVDFMTAGGGNPLIGDWSTTPAGAWMKENAWKYGWVMSYPKGMRSITCFHYEPWHYRYVGREPARGIHDSGLTVREYLWANFTQVDPATGEPLSSPTAPVATADPVPGASPAASQPDATSRPPATTPTPAGTPPSSEATSFLYPLPPAVLGVLAIGLGVIALIAIGRWRRARRG